MAYGSEICHQFAAGRRRHGDNCKYDHSTPTKPDHRIQGGAMLPKFAAAVQTYFKTFYKQRKKGKGQKEPLRERADYVDRFGCAGGA